MLGEIIVGDAAFGVPSHNAAFGVPSHNAAFGVPSHNAAFGVPPPDSVSVAPYIELSEVGNITRKHIENINLQKGITLDKYVIMPNHIHLIVHVDSGTPRAASPTKARIPQMVNALKGLISKSYGAAIFQRSYHDHIIRSEAEYHKIRKYIEENPANWQDDCYFK